MLYQLFMSYYDIQYSSLATAGFPIMAALAKGLPVFLIPEQHLVPAMRNDMVNDRGGREPPSLPAIHAQWVLAKETRPRASPFATIATFGGVFAGVLRPVLFAIDTVR